MSVLNADTKILNKLLAGKIQQYRQITPQDQVVFNLCMQGSLIYANLKRWYMNKLKNRSNMIISIDTEKAVDKIQHHQTLKTLGKIDIEGTF